MELTKTVVKRVTMWIFLSVLCRAVGDVYVYPQYTGFIASDLCGTYIAKTSYAVQRSTKWDYDK